MQYGPCVVTWLMVDILRGIERTSGIVVPTETVTVGATGTGVPVFTSFANDPIREYRCAVAGIVLFGMASLWIAFV